MIDRGKYSVVIVLSVLSLVVAGIELFYERHPHVSYEDRFNFYGFYALVVSVAMMLIAPVMRMLSERGKDYYDV